MCVPCLSKASVDARVGDAARGVSLDATACRTVPAAKN
ncbi:hypothetical protein I550_0870 [Mycobacterium intracellulare 1956]|uniref:Uncharacterized protein n=1 Tax=Mycobacterium intracellulare 1956 TaxID=1299331 RepID=X8CMY6_MYCIT|nr:hypothetical protein OCQ_10320 [Mycobacterium paraintracellulare]EUA25750.1 hypothetical protein I548_3838 [Mycobacterium intracellulare]EUA57742.1 hypothetical protein I550_0870 [Mycobacterium intracellulare 1956]